MEPACVFTINRSTGSQLELANPPGLMATRHSGLSFDDGNLAVLAGDSFFLVHQGLIARHSAPIDSAIKQLYLHGPPAHFLEGRPVLHLDDPPNDMLLFLLAIYDGVSSVSYDKHGFADAAAVLRLATKYEVKHLRADILRGLSFYWPTDLDQWDLRESEAEIDIGVYVAKDRYPNPIMVVTLARAVNAPELLPSAFYDLSRAPPSTIAAGYSRPGSSEVHRLSPVDLMNLFKGREHASRFLSTFIVNELEGRKPPAACACARTGHRACQVTFEAITFGVLHQINGAGSIRGSDPLHAILDLESQSNRDFIAGEEVYKACESCREEFSGLVESAREDFWHKLPQWFGVESELPSW
ncbi:hypothetical protein HGRIS_002810 [Hohenbuehelia grisea]|uniref:BTB domain-containing protein n=1 Tax=Hohenbuehelia grisea TaxID=104357 RepID=A0ABR3JLR8_9AGAR